MNIRVSTKAKLEKDIIVLIILLMQGWLTANIPEPDTIFYGELYINGKLVTAADDVTVSAKLNGVEVAKYKMGSNIQVGNNFLLRIPMQSTDDGAIDPLKAKVGDSIQIYVKQGFGSQIKVLNSDFQITGRGIIKYYRLFVGNGYAEVGGDFNQDYNVNLADLILFGANWLNSSCVSPSWCNGCDINKNGIVSMDDLCVVADNWLKCLSVDCY